MNSQKHERSRPGATFAFKPANTLSSVETPNFGHSSRQSQSSTSSGILQEIGTMVNERAPPKVPSKSTAPFGGFGSREKSPDSDTDISALIGGWSSHKSSARDGTAPAGGGSPATAHPTFGHPTKMMSSLKQKANVFIHQKSRPEHHLDTRVSGPKAPSYQARKPPSLPVFDSGGLGALPPTKSKYVDEVFYTDPEKASEDLKALLEGGMDSEDEDEAPASQESQPEQPTEEASTQSSQDSQDTQNTSVPKASKAHQVDKDGTVPGLKVKLLPHQVEGVTWMCGRELGPVKKGKVPKGGILADDMGLGKTLQSISLMLTNPKPEKDGKGWKKQFEGVEKTTLVVAPLALIRQWEDEINKRIEKSHGLKVLVHHGPQRTKRFKDLALYDVVVTTYQILVSEFGNTSDKEDGVKTGCFGLHWWRVILDEAHTIKNRNAKSTKACYALRSEYRWCLSGTPMQNNLDELQSLIRFLQIKPYDDIKQWKEHIDLPLKNGKGHIAIRRLHSILRCFMKRRTKEILKEDGALNPGGKPTAEGEVSVTGFRHTERKVVAISAELSPAERRFYDRLMARTDENLKEMMASKLSYTNAFTMLLRLRQACNHPKLVEGKLDKDKDAMTTDASQKPQEPDMDSMADMFAGMGITSKSCSICGRSLSDIDTDLGRDHCGECHEDLALFNKHEKPSKKKPKKKSKKIKTKKIKRGGQEKTDVKTRRPRNRKAVIDSDDEEEGSWLVPEGERGGPSLGKAGGEEDENAEGGGDTIGPEDTEDEDEANDRSNLSSFVVDDEVAKGEPGYRSIEDAADDDDSLLSLSAITKQMASQTLEDKEPLSSQASASGTELDTDSDSGSESGSEETDSGVDESELFSSDDERRTRGGNPQIMASAKIREMSRLLHAEAKEHKFIVFSQFTSMLDLIEPFLRKDGFKFTRYDGSMKNDAREESLRRLREDKSVRILLCSLKCGSLGLNLTAATRVIIIEPFWNPFVEEQAIDRVHRLTQTVDVVVYKLTVANTVEESILDLQNKKRELALAAIDGGLKKGAMKLGLNEIIELFRPGGYHGNSRGDSFDDLDVEAEERRRARGATAMIRGKGLKKQESSVYGRRW